ncbi:MAG: hypothetical protein B6I31_01690 [Desulfobacteraceae bacterium 4572_19]|nr:MAG: hypothetical protein B6I31_01690 [Desulfobacteraceae bacterium 4572_19]
MKNKSYDIFTSAVILCFLIIFFSFTGCVLNTPSQPPVNPMSVVQPAPPNSHSANKSGDTTYYDVMPPAEGSLWSNTGNMLFVDNKAFRVGDTVIVDIVENTSSSLSANTTNKRDRKINVKAPSVFGYLKSLQGKNPFLDGSSLLDVEFNNELKGQGKSDRSGQVTASIGARVIDVLPNGNLSIRGKRTTKVNFEEQFIIVSGIIRPTDIGSDNRVKSTYLADAKIEYFGKGDITDQQRPGWMSRILTHVWPF